MKVFFDHDRIQDEIQNLRSYDGHFANRKLESNSQSKRSKGCKTGQKGLAAYGFFKVAKGVAGGVITPTMALAGYAVETALGVVGSVAMEKMHGLWTGCTRSPQAHHIISEACKALQKSAMFYRGKSAPFTKRRPFLNNARHLNQDEFIEAIVSNYKKAKNEYLRLKKYCSKSYSSHELIDILESRHVSISDKYEAIVEYLIDSTVNSMRTKRRAICSQIKARGSEVSSTIDEVTDKIADWKDTINNGINEAKEIASTGVTALKGMTCEAIDENIVQPNPNFQKFLSKMSKCCDDLKSKALESMPVLELVSQTKNSQIYKNNGKFLFNLILFSIDKVEPNMALRKQKLTDIAKSSNAKDFLNAIIKYYRQLKGIKASDSLRLMTTSSNSKSLLQALEKNGTSTPSQFCRVETYLGQIDENQDSAMFKTIMLLLDCAAVNNMANENKINFKKPTPYIHRSAYDALPSA